MNIGTARTNKAPKMWNAWRSIPLSGKTGFAPILFPIAPGMSPFAVRRMGWSWLETPRSAWTLTTLRWKPGRTASQSARIHQPDVCLQASGAIPVRELSPVSIAADGGVVLFHAWLFMLADRPLYVFYNLREEGNRDQLNARLNQDWSAWSRVQRAMVGERNLGQQSIEIALQGYDSQADALDALKTRLPSLITLTHAEK